MNHVDVVVIGAGAAGLMAAVTAAQRGLSVKIIEHTAKIGEKIRISGGGRCNFTNIHASKKNYISANPHFCVSALANYTPHDFIKLIESHQISYHEKTLGQQFCDGSSKQIIQLFMDMCNTHHVEVLTNCRVTSVTKNDHFYISTTHGPITTTSLIIATGGLSIPKIGASDFGHQIARQFNIPIVKTMPALVPLIASEVDSDLCASLTGVSNASTVSYKKTAFDENILFTHKGLSGPAILQISSYMDDFSHKEVSINLLPNSDLHHMWTIDKNNKKTPANYLKQFLTNRLVDTIGHDDTYHTAITDLKKSALNTIADRIHQFTIKINGSEGYAKAEVTRGGIDTRALSSKTMMSEQIPGLFFIGEVVDVTGWLGGYNFQWAWASGYAAGMHC